MGKNSGIAWTDHTWNPFQGCRKVSPGCLNCYMYRDKIRYGHDPDRVLRSKPGTFNAPLKWHEPARVFVCSWSDFFIEDADAWRDEAWEIMRRTPHLTYMLLTKRPENVIDRLPPDWPLKNVWLGVTAENQSMAEKRIPVLLGIPAPIRFLSVEPMIGPVNLEIIPDVFFDAGMPFEWQRLENPGIHWVICGGESGPEARDMDSVWALGLKKQCARAGVPFFMKQMSSGEPIPDFLQGQELPEIDKQSL